MSEKKKHVAWCFEASLFVYTYFQARFLMLHVGRVFIHQSIINATLESTHFLLFHHCAHFYPLEVLMLPNTCNYCEYAMQRINTTHSSCYA